MSIRDALEGLRSEWRLMIQCPASGMLCFCANRDGRRRKQVGRQRGLGPAKGH